MKKKKIVIIVTVLCFVPIVIILAALLDEPTMYSRQAETVVIKNINVIPMNRETILENYDVFIDGGTIQTVKPYTPGFQPVGAEVIDGRGKYLIPGLTDMHFHTNSMASEKYLMVALVNGITIVRHLNGFDKIVRLREEVRQGTTLFPDLYLSNTIFDGPDSTLGGAEVMISTVQEAREAVEEGKAKGLDYIFVYSGLSSDVYQEIVTAAKEHDIPVIGAVNSSLGSEFVLASGQYTIEHAHFMVGDVDRYVEAGVWNCPTLLMYKNMEDLSRSDYKDYISRVDHFEYFSKIAFKTIWKFYQLDEDDLIGDYEEAKQAVKEFHDKGGKIIAGTETLMPGIFPGFSLHDEMAELVESGLRPYDALKTATYNPAESLGILARKGTIEEGKAADLVILNANPFEDIHNTKSISDVLLKGSRLSREDLENTLESIRKTNWLL